MFTYLHIIFAFILLNIDWKNLIIFPLQCLQ